MHSALDYMIHVLLLIMLFIYFLTISFHFQVTNLMEYTLSSKLGYVAIAQIETYTGDAMAGMKGQVSLVYSY